MTETKQAKNIISFSQNLSKKKKKKKKKNSESSCSWTTALQIVLLLDVLLFFLAACVFHCSMQKAKARGAQTFSEAMQ